jgi:hypothetical protein
MADTSLKLGRSSSTLSINLVSDPFAMGQNLECGERKWLRRRSELLDADSAAWRVIDNAEDGRLALGVLANAS